MGHQEISLGQSITAEKAADIVDRLAALFVVPPPTVNLMSGMEQKFVAFCYPLSREIFFRQEYIPYVAPFHEFMHVYYTDVTGMASQVPSEAFAQYFGSMSLTQGEELLNFSCNECRQSQLKMLNTGQMECLQCGAMYAFDLFPPSVDTIPSGLDSHADISMVAGQIYSPDDWTMTPRNTGYPNIAAPGKIYGIPDTIDALPDTIDWTTQPVNTGFPNITVPGKIYGLDGEEELAGQVISIPGGPSTPYDEWDPNWRGYGSGPGGSRTFDVTDTSGGNGGGQASGGDASSGGGGTVAGPADSSGGDASSGGGSASSPASGGDASGGGGGGASSASFSPWSEVIPLYEDDDLSYELMPMDGEEEAGKWDWSNILPRRKKR